MTPTLTDCLLIIDVQNDFCPGGALEVPTGDEVVPLINRLIHHFSHRILTQDWHPPVTFPSPRAMPRPHPLRRSSSTMGPRCCGPTIACSVPGAPSSTQLSGPQTASSSCAKAFAVPSTPILHFSRTTRSRQPAFRAIYGLAGLIGFTSRGWRSISAYFTRHSTGKEKGSRYR